MEKLFLRACEDGSSNIVSKFIRKGLNVNCTDLDGSTGLMKACLNENYDIVKMLIEANADQDQIDKYGKNALHYAVKSNNEKICKYLCVNKIESTQQTHIGKLEPLDYSLKGVDETKVKYEDKNYMIQLKNIKQSEDPCLIIGLDEPKTNEDRIYNLILRYNNMILSDLESDGDEKTGGEVYKKSKKKKKSKGKKKKSAKGKKSKGKKKKK